jgi:steroid delta-isomerase-like uncharacterized protein
MSQNTEIVRRFEHAFADNDVATIDELCDPGLVDHNPVPGMGSTLADFKATIAGYKNAFPDLSVEVGAIIGEGDTVASRWVGTGTHQGDLPGIPATGKRVRIEGMNFYTLSNGRITEVWTQYDGVGMLQQLGVMPVEEPV